MVSGIENAEEHEREHGRDATGGIERGTQRRSGGRTFNGSFAAWIKCRIFAGTEA